MKPSALSCSSHNRKLYFYPCLLCTKNLHLQWCWELKGRCKEMHWLLKSAATVVVFHLHCSNSADGIIHTATWMHLDGMAPQAVRRALGCLCVPKEFSEHAAGERDTPPAFFLTSLCTLCLQHSKSISVTYCAFSDGATGVSSFLCSDGWGSHVLHWVIN